MAADLGTSVAVFQENKLLLIKREDLAVWGLPGGSVDPRESIAQAAVREIQEETGLLIELERLVGIYSLPNWHSGSSHNVLFAGHAVGGKLHPQEREVLAAQFFALDELPEPLMWWHRQRIDDAIHGVGGSVTWMQDVRWPFAENVKPDEVRPAKQDTEVAKQAFYTRYFSARRPGDEKSEVGIQQ